MRKVIVLLTGCLLFIAGYQQARRQTEYMTTKMDANQQVLPAKPMVVSQRHPLFAFKLKQANFNW